LSNGKTERWHKSPKTECIPPGTPLSLDHARRLEQGYVEHYYNVRPNSAIGYITPKDMPAGRQPEIHLERDRKLEEARKQRQIRARLAPRSTQESVGRDWARESDSDEGGLGA